MTGEQDAFRLTVRFGEARSPHVESTYITGPMALVHPRHRGLRKEILSHSRRDMQWKAES